MLQASNRISIAEALVAQETEMIHWRPTGHKLAADSSALDAKFVPFHELPQEEHYAEVIHVDDNTLTDQPTV